MACIDIFAPGRALNVSFLMEQIWLAGKGKRLVSTEIYDFLLQVNDGQELGEFYISSPHFCRSRIDGGWKDHVWLARVRDSHSGWGWPYLGQEVKNGRLRMKVPNALASAVNDETELEGIDVADAKICWDERLVGGRLELMERMKKSLYKVSLPTPLKAIESDRMWFRIIIQPAVLDIAGIRRLFQLAFVELVIPLYRTYFLLLAQKSRAVTSNLVRKQGVRHLAHASCATASGRTPFGVVSSFARNCTSHNPNPPPVRPIYVLVA